MKPVYKLIETHAHLEEITDLGQAIATARAANIIAMVAVGSDYQSNQKVLALAKQYEGLIYPALGVHPWNLGDVDIERDLEFIEVHISEAVAIGEIGLDYDKRVRARADKDRQKEVLRLLLKIAKTYGQPAIIHSRYAWQDALNLAVEAQLEKVVFHWYTGTSSVLREIVNRGFFISATPAVEYHEEHRRAVKEVPLDRLLLETDSPVVYRRGTEYEYESRPADLLRVLRAVCQLRGMDEAQIAEISASNARRLFGLEIPS